MSLTQRFFSDAFRDINRAMAVLEHPNAFFNTFHTPTIGSQLGNMNNFVRYPTSDLVEKANHFEVHAELPGYDKNNIKIEMPDGQTLVISGSVQEQHEVRSPPAEEVKDASSGEGKTNTDEAQVVAKKDEDAQVTSYKPQYWVNERVSGSFTRSFKFPHSVKTDEIKASFENGVLKIIVPKMTEAQPRQIKIE